jgi:threonine dehydratase
MNDWKAIKKEVLEAAERIRPHIRETPLEFSPSLSQISKSRIHLKLENIQTTGSFKLRGAANKILALSEEQKKKGLVTASSGNHGAAVAHMIAQEDLTGTIYLPETACQAKIENLRLYGADLAFLGEDCVMAENVAREEAQRSGRTFISPYNDLKIIAGQGTVGLELTRQINHINAVLVPVGGGGLISGIGGYLKSIDPSIRIIGCQPENSAVMYESIKEGKILDLPSKPTLSDGTAGGIESGAITFDICREVVDDFVLVTEEEIKHALCLVIEKQHMLGEGAAALSVAGLLQHKTRFKDKNVVLVLSGARLDIDQLKAVLS